MLRKSLFFLLLCSFLLPSCAPVRTPEPTRWRHATVNHTIPAGNHLTPLWQRTIYTETDGYGNACFAFSGTLFVLGSENEKGSPSIIAIDEQNGKTKWTRKSGPRFTGTATNLYASNGQKVFAISPADGATRWTATLTLVRDVNQLYFYQDQLFVSASGFPFVVLSPQDGKVIHQYSTVDGFRSAYPKVPFYPADAFDAILTGSDAIRATGKLVYSFDRIDLNTGKTIWKLDSQAISNAALIGKTLFFINKSDKISAIDVITSGGIFDVPIKPSIEFFNKDLNANPDTNVQHIGYYTCADPQTRNLFLILGDSRQMFAFALNE